MACAAIWGCVLQTRDQCPGGPRGDCNKGNDPTWSKIWHLFARPGKPALLQTARGYQGRLWQIIWQGPERARSGCLEKQINPSSELRLRKIFKTQGCLCSSVGGLRWLATGGYPHWFTSSAIWGHSKLLGSYHRTFSHFPFSGQTRAEKWTTGSGWRKIKNKREGKVSLSNLIKQSINL